MTITVPQARSLRSVIIQSFPTTYRDHHNVRGTGLKRVAVLVFSVVFVLILVYCGGSSNTNQQPSQVKHRALVSNTFSGVLQVMDTQNDTTSFTAQTVNSAGQLVPGAPVSIPVGNSVTWQTLSADRSKTMVYDQSDNTVFFINNSTEAITTSVPLAGPASMGLFSSDGNSAYVSVRTVPISGSRAGGVQVVSIANSNITTTYPVPSASIVALSPNGQILLVFANNSDSVFLINLTATTPAAVEVPGFARPVNAFFSSDSNTAYVLSCGWECGDPAPGQASVAQLDIPSMTIKATVPVGGASAGLLNGTTLYVAGTSFTAGPVFDSVNVTNMTRNTANSVAINDGLHTTMALAMNNKLYIGAVTCSNSNAGCLSVVNVSDNTASTPQPPNCALFGNPICAGAVTGMLAIANRNVVYVMDGGYQVIYDTTTDAPQQTQVIFSGALFTIVQVDQ
jgi:hypothetical protein